jgi:aryl-alcohol dehydrogenase-like predicted oxidoreductase
MEWGRVEKRRLGRLEHMSSVLIYGGAALAEVDQDTADSSIALALEAGINHFDTAANYGEAELRYGPWMSEIRDRIFLSTKTEQRSKDEARREIERSLERLQVDEVDLIQLHAVNDLEQLERATGPGGALEAAIEARDEGLVRAIGITGHGHAAPSTHLEALRRFPFETVLTPLNYLLYSHSAYREDYEALVQEIARQDAALMVIKAIARGLWREDREQRYATWYEPFDQQEHIDAAVDFVLGRSEVTGLCVAGDTRLLPALVRAEARDGRRTESSVLEDVEDYASPFTPAAGRIGPL